VNDLVNHDFGKLELFMFLISTDILGDHSCTIFAIGETWPSVAVHTLVFLIIILVKSADSGAFSNAPVAHCPCSVVFPAKIEGLQEEHYRDTDEGHKQKNNLDGSLPSVELLLDGTGLQEHVNKHVEQSRRVLSDSNPIDGPLVDDGEDEIAKNGLEKDHARNEVGKDVDWSLEMTSINVRKAKRIGHLMERISKVFGRESSLGG